MKIFQFFLTIVLAAGVMASSACTSASVEYRGEPARVEGVPMGTPPGWHRSGKVPPGLAKKGVTMGMPWAEARDKAGDSVIEIKMKGENGEIVLSGEGPERIFLHVEDGVVAGWRSTEGRPMAPPNKKLKMKPMPKKK